MTAPAETRRNLWRKSSRMVARSDPAHRSDICLKRPGWTGEARTRAVQTPRSLSASPAPAGWQHRFAGGYWGRSPQNAGIFIGWYCLVSIRNCQ
jgi:hypothetical protein